MNLLRVVPTHSASSNPLAEEGTTTSNTSMNKLRVASTHPASLSQLVEEEAANEKIRV
jgi:hypothetical protein